MTRSATAFAPGHVTGLFTVDEADDPTVAGSRGAGVCLEAGVTATVEPATGADREPGVFLDDSSVAIEALETVLDTLAADVVVDLATDLPLGAGFGVSGAAALATAFATNACLDRELSADELTTIAHGAEVQAGTGLGDVVAQARGGVPIRLEAGAPRHGECDAIPARSRVEYHVIDELATEDVLGGETDLLTHAGERALSRVVAEPTLPSFVRASRQFSREADLLTDPVRDVIEDVAEAGGTAFMAMLGETVVAFDTGLTDAGYDADVTAVDPCGVRLLE